MEILSAFLLRRLFMADFIDIAVRSQFVYVLNLQLLFSSLLLLPSKAITCALRWSN